MDFEFYQNMARTTAIYPTKFQLVYPALGVANEAGELAGKVKKMLRDNNGVITDEIKEGISKEAGDVLWYLAQLCSDLDLRLGDVAQENLDKLASRQARGVLGGSGDNR